MGESCCRGVQNNRQLPRRIHGGAEQLPVPAENSIKFGAAISNFRFLIRRLSRATHWIIQLNSAPRFLISDSQTIARNPLEKSIQFGAAISNFRFPIRRLSCARSIGEFNGNWAQWFRFPIPIPMPVVQPGRFPFDLAFDFNLKKNWDFDFKSDFFLNICPFL